MFFKITKLIIVVLIGSLSQTIISQQVNASGENWEINECQSDSDSGGDPVIVCDDGTSIGVFWNDGSFVNGYCDSSESYNIDYKGLSKRNAISWVNYFCD
tara:strand:+ start:162 stop:461 length:300 start_codon:yes stop_codon:yes gene_type:complete